MIPPSFVQELLSRTDIADVVGRHVALKKTGANLSGLCPFHSEKSPSFTVSPSKQFYYCFGCGASGDAIRFLTEHHGLSFVEAVQDLAQQAGLQVPEDDASPADRAEATRLRERQATLTDVLERAAHHYRQQLKATPRAVNYLKGRGLTGEVAARFALGYAPEGWKALASAFPDYDDPLLVESGLVIAPEDNAAEGDAPRRRYDRFRDRIMFPIRSVKGDVIGFGGRVLDRGEPKYLNSPETPLFVKGRELYGLYEARTAMRERGYVLVTEGYMDVVALAQLGFPHAVATLGTACTAEHVHKLLRFTDQVVFSFDGDAAGRRAAGRALEAALPHATDTRSFRFLFLPPEHDPDSYVRAEGRDAFERCIAQAVPLSRQLIEHASVECDLASSEGRAKMLAQARPLWSALPEGSLRLQLLAELARTAALDVRELQTLWRASISPAGGAAHEPGPSRARPAPGPQRRAVRQAPKRPEERAIQLLLSQSAWWDQLPPEERELLHALPPPHGGLVGWLERDLAEHGARPWAVLRHALAEDTGLDSAWRDHAMAYDPDVAATYADLRRAVDELRRRSLEARMADLLARSAVQPEALDAYRALFRELQQLKQPAAGAEG